VASELETPAEIRLVQVGAKLYPEAQFIGAMTEAGLQHLESSIPQGSTMRNAMRTVRDSKNEETLLKVRALALRLLLKNAEPALPSKGAKIVAKFPAPPA
jgi:hypothetical protein